VLQYPDAELVACFTDMLKHFDLPRTFGMESQALVHFVDGVRGRYRDNPYHNFKHGVSVAHVCFVALNRAAATVDVLKPLDRLAVLVAGLCHDVDHPGVNNAFMVRGGEGEEKVSSRRNSRTHPTPLSQSNSYASLAIRYNDVSVLENYHAATMFDLLDVGRKGTRKRVEGSDAAGAATATSPPSHGRRRSVVGVAAAAAAGAPSTPAPTPTPTPAAAAPPAGGAGGADAGVEETLTVLNLTKPELAQFRKVAIAAILATDMQHHAAFISVAKDTTPEKAHELPAKQMAELLVHAAGEALLSNLTRTPHLVNPLPSPLFPRTQT